MRVRILPFLLAVWIYEITPIHAQAPSRELTISFDGPISERPAPFVFVKGEIAGVAPGTVAIPDSPQDVAVEVGIAQLSPTPLYSFAIGPKSFDEGIVEVVSSTFAFGTSTGEGLWSGLALGANNKRLIKLERKQPGSYSIHLPAEVFQGVAKYWASRIIELPKARNWFGTVAQSQNASAKTGLDHLSFDKGANHTVQLTNKADQIWSGAYTKTAGLLNGYDLPTEKWTIISKPTGAMIYTEGGAQGSTTSTISIAKTGSRFVVLKKDGFQQCTAKDCEQQNTGGGVTLICELKKAR